MTLHRLKTSFIFHFIPNGMGERDLYKRIPKGNGHILKHIRTQTAWRCRYRLFKKPPFTIRIGRGGAQISYVWFGLIKFIYHR